LLLLLLLRPEKLLFPETRPTLVFTLKILWTFYWRRNFSGSVSSCFLIMHHARIILSTRITKHVKSKVKVEGNKEKNV